MRGGVCGACLVDEMGGVGEDEYEIVVMAVGITEERCPKSRADCILENR